MEKTLVENLSLEKSLALSNLSKKAYRTLAIGLLVAFSSAVLFASLVLGAGLKSGIRGLRSRLGADLLVVPEGYESGAESVLLTGEPNYFYMDRSVLDSVRRMAGIEKASPQFYLTSLSESCCDFPVQLIGFERDSDFVVHTWLKDRSRESSSGEFLISGSNVSINDGRVRFFGGEHEVSGRLTRSGTGMDNTIFCDMDSLMKIHEDALEKGFCFISDGDERNRISTVLVSLSPDASPDAVAVRIKEEVPGVQVIVGERFLRDFSKRMSSFQVFFQSISILVLLISVLSLAIAFSLIVNERRREFSILRVLGADRSRLMRILLFESAFLGVGGSLAGVAVSALAVIPFNSLIAQKMALPFAIGGAWEILAYAVLAVAVCTASSVLAAVKGAVRVSRVDPYGDVK